jgi:hypothetical protein
MSALPYEFAMQAIREGAKRRDTRCWMRPLEFELII